MLKYLCKLFSSDKSDYVGILKLLRELYCRVRVFGNEAYGEYGWDNN